MATTIPIYDPAGDQVDSITVPHNLVYESGRTSVAGDVWYKGAGIPYRCHLSHDPRARGVYGPAKVFYAGYLVIDPVFHGKHGIFQQRYQPYFSDWIGSCGPKEGAILKNSREFPLSAVEVIDYVMFDPENRQSYYVLRYTGKRERFIPDGQVEALLDLLRVMVRFGWNFPWDKAAIRDITADGRISDVADMFRSTKLEHRLGTVYSVFYSLFKLAPELYRRISDAAPVFASVVALNEFGVRFGGRLGKRESAKDMSARALKLLVAGRTCAGIEDRQFGDQVRRAYAQRLAQAMEVIT